MNQIEINGLMWTVTETTVDSHVFNDMINGKQEVAFRLVCERPISSKEDF